MRLQIRLLLVMVTATGCACSQPSEPGIVNDRARARWAAQEIRDYRFDFDRQCFCVPEAVEPVRIEVRDGEIAAVRSRTTGESLAASAYVQWFTVDQLFRLIEQAEAAGQDVRVDYHWLGYPRKIEIGSLAADAGVVYAVSALERIP